MTGNSPAGRVTMADFSGLGSRFRYVAMIPQVETGCGITWPWRIKRCKAT